MSDGGWHTLAEIAMASEAPEASVSARLRDFRKPRYGMHTVQKRRVIDGGGLWEYRILIEPTCDHEWTDDLFDRRCVKCGAPQDDSDAVGE